MNALLMVEARLGAPGPGSADQNEGYHSVARRSGTASVSHAQRKLNFSSVMLECRSSRAS
jgi:hypothetical protein